MNAPSRGEIERGAAAGRAFERSNLRNVDLAGAMLVGIKLGWSELDGANLERADLSGADLAGATLREAFLMGAKLRDTHFGKADLDGADLTGADLTGADLSRANLSGARLQGANLQGARLSYAQLDAAVLAGADLTGANLGNADLEEADLGRARCHGTNFARANLRGANFEEAQLERAVFERATAQKCNFSGAKLQTADLREADCSQSSFVRTDLRDADLRRAILADTRHEEAVFTGAKIFGVDFGKTLAPSVVIEWADASSEGDGSKLLDIRQVRRMLSPEPVAQGKSRRYFGAGDVLRNAELDFGAGAQVQIESRLERCTISLSDDAELVLGERGVMHECTVNGGRLTIHGRFVEGTGPSLVRPRALVVTASGVVVAGIEQPDEPTRFAFERGCRLRLNIKNDAGSAT